MPSTKPLFEVSCDPVRLDFERIHAWLASSYWSPGISRERVEKAACGSALLVGAYQDGLQVGYLRVISDATTFAWICDVFVDPASRSRGVARAMLRFALDHADFQGLRRWVLATKDAHAVYSDVGFISVSNPERWMILHPDEADPASDSR